MPEDVFVSGKEGYPWYRIPAMVRLPSGGIAVFTEGRKTGTDIGYNDVVYKLSKDEGETWSPLRTARAHARASHSTTYHTPARARMQGTYAYTCSAAQHGRGCARACN